MRVEGRVTVDRTVSLRALDCRLLPKSFLSDLRKGIQGFNPGVCKLELIMQL